MMSQFFGGLTDDRMFPWNHRMNKKKISFELIKSNYTNSNSSMRLRLYGARFLFLACAVNARA